MFAETKSLAFNPLDDFKEKMKTQTRTLYITQAIQWCQSNFTKIFQVKIRLGQC